jgi:hypothetical protein
MYNRFVRYSILLALTLMLAACAKDINNKEAVQAAVMERLTKVSGLNVAGMDVEVSNVTFSGNNAEAQVAFKPKGSTETMLKMSYKLEKSGEAWKVVSSSGGMGGGMGGMGGGQLPPGHTPVPNGGTAK